MLCQMPQRGNELAFLKISERSELIITKPFFFQNSIHFRSTLNCRSHLLGTFPGASRTVSIPPLFPTQSSGLLPPSLSGALPSLSLSFLPPLGRGTRHWDLEEIELNYEGISLQYDWHHFLHTTEHHSHISRCGGMKIGHAPFFLSSF